MEGFLDAAGGGGADTLVDRECLPQVLRGLTGVAVLQVAVAESFQGAGFLWGRANGFTVPDRGKLRPDVWTAWRTANR